jgi:hypothetical protein
MDRAAPRPGMDRLLPVSIINKTIDKSKIMADKHQTFFICVRLNSSVVDFSYLHRG